MIIGNNIYPLTIVADRYCGAYSDAAYIAWNLKHNEIPMGMFLDDITCMEFWSENEIVCGKGNTVTEAYKDLLIKLKGGVEE